MKALVLEDYKKLVYRDVPKPEPKADEVLVRVRAAAICGSDVHGFDGSSGRRIPPLIMGHEAAGEIVEVGGAVQGYAVGDRVTFDSTVFCGACDYCLNGQPNLCERRQVLGVACAEHRREGCFAEYVAVPERILFRLPDGLPYEIAALVEPAAIAFHAINISTISFGDTALVIGAGTIGLMLVKLLTQTSVARIIVSDLDEAKLESAKRSGADYLIGPGMNVIEEVKKITGVGADIAFEAVGISATVNNAIAATRKGGRVTLVGNVSQEVSFPLQSVTQRQISLQGSCAVGREFPRCLAAMASGRARFDDVISLTAPLADGAALFDRLYAMEKGLSKVVLIP